uniref:SMB domain-containing protein n=1 Tax=Oryzias sinensis TaxID=183150 RepID=A0A8C7Z1Q4_9TELE
MNWAKTSQRKKKIIICVLAASIVTLILGLGLGLGLELQSCKSKVPPGTSCRDRCYQPFDDEIPGCRCDSNCAATGSCCFDFHDICTIPTQQWECTKIRCGEKRLTQSKCHCSDDCLSAGDCCTNYKHICQGETKEWVEGECEDLSTPSCPAGFKLQPLLLVSLDGLRAEYMQTWSTVMPVLNKIRTCGTSASYMQPAFPSKTFPNHYTIVTGLYPESNGLIDNTMYDPVFNATFSLSNSEKNNPDWYLGQPVWHTAKNQGLKSGTFFWPGSDVEINGSFPNIYKPYDGDVPFEERVLTVLKWLQLPDNERPDFYTLYLEEPDKSGHSFGPVSGGIIISLQGVDKIIGQLMNGLKQIGLDRCLNIVILADHGMEEISCDRKEAMQDLGVDTSLYVVTEGPFGRIRAKNCKKPDQKITPYLKAHLPKRFHYANSRRIEDVSVLVEPKWLNPGSLTFCFGGNHGYDNDAESMHALFLSYGPKFQFRTEVEPFSSIELYNLMCDVLEITPSENNGTHGSMNHALRNPYHTPVHPVEQSAPGQCPLVSLVPEDDLGCSCSSLLLPFVCFRHINLRLLQANLTVALVVYLNVSADQQYDALLMSNVVPMYPRFKEIWDFFHNSLLKKYAFLYNEINVVTGPVFDYNYNGWYDTPDQILESLPGTNISIPTHYFVLMTSCGDSTQTVSSCTGQLQTASLLLPHRADASESCKEASRWVEDHMWFHQARVRDVELITGLDFYQGSKRPVAELLKTKTRPTFNRDPCVP